MKVTRTPVFPSGDPNQFAGAYRWTVVFASLTDDLPDMAVTPVGFGEESVDPCRSPVADDDFACGCPVLLWPQRMAVHFKAFK